MGRLRRRDLCRARGRGRATTRNPPAANTRAHGRAPERPRRDRRASARRRRRRGDLVRRARRTAQRRPAAGARARARARLARARARTLAAAPVALPVAHGGPPISRRGALSWVSSRRKGTGLLLVVHPWSGLGVVGLVGSFVLWGQAEGGVLL